MNISKEDLEWLIGVAKDHVQIVEWDRSCNEQDHEEFQEIQKYITEIEKKAGLDES